MIARALKAPKTRCEWNMTDWMPQLFRAFNAKSFIAGFFLGRKPRLLHFAPLALGPGVFP